MKKLLIVLLLAASIIGISVFSTYVVRRDEIAARRHTVEQAWNHVNSAMQRRADLVPAVISVMRHMASRNRATCAEEEKARPDVQSANPPVEPTAATGRLDAAVAKLLASAQDDAD